MKNLLPNEVDELVRTGIARLKVVSPAPGSISYPARRRVPIGKFVMAGAVAALGAFGLSVFLLGSPSVTLAQVAEAQGKVTRCRVTYRRFLNGGKTWAMVMAQDGKRWKSGGIVGDETLTILPFRKRVPPFAIIDGPQPSPIREQMFKVEGLLRKGVKPTIERGILIDGRRVDRFLIKTTYRNGRDETLEQMLDIDPSTRLPIRFKEMRDNNQWGDQWEYDYSPIPASTFERPSLEGLRIFDEREFAKTVFKVAQQNDSFVAVDQSGHLNIFIQSAESANMFPQLEIRIGGKTVQKGLLFVGRRVKIAGMEFQVIDANERQSDQIRSLVNTSRNVVQIELISPHSELKWKRKTVPLLECGIFEVSFERYKTETKQAREYRSRTGDISPW